jgi:hypothetical protein
MRRSGVRSSSSPPHTKAAFVREPASVLGSTSLTRDSTPLMMKSPNHFFRSQRCFQGYVHFAHQVSRRPRGQEESKPFAVGQVTQALFGKSGRVGHEAVALGAGGGQYPYFPLVRCCVMSPMGPLTAAICPPIMSCKAGCVPRYAACLSSPANKGVKNRGAGVASADKVTTGITRVLVR